MISRIGFGLVMSTLVTLIVVIVAVSVVKNALGELLTPDPVVVGQDGVSILVAGDAEDRVKKCKVRVLLDTRRCGELKIVVMDARRMPFITRNIKLAWGTGRPFELTRNSAKATANRRAACGGFVKKYPKGQCDEYPFATTDEGGAGARTEEVPGREQSCQGGLIGTGYAKAGIKQGDEFLVVVSNPADVAATSFQGRDLAKDRTTCG